MSNFTTTTGHFFHYIKNVFLVNHYYDIRTLKSFFLVHHNIEIDKDHYYKSSWSLLQKSEGQKEWKEHRKSQFCLIFEVILPMA